MKTLLIALGAAATLASAAAPALAQPRWDDHRAPAQSVYGGRLTTSYVDSLQSKIRIAAREGRISRGESRELLAEFRQVQPLAFRVQRGQASRWEVQRLTQAVNRIEAAVADHPRYGRNDDRRFRR